MTELTKVKRCEDIWWNSVVEEFRHGDLTEETHADLHGHRRPGRHLDPAEAASRRRVLTGYDDPRLHAPKFAEAM
eukprot:12929030-Prorocentrum_lima.AAC.1